MSAPLPVQIVRPRRSATENCAAFVGRIALGLFANAWFVMLLVPTFSHYRPGYWQVVAFILAVRFVLPTFSDYTYWTRAARKGAKS